MGWHGLIGRLHWTVRFQDKRGEWTQNQWHHCSELSIPERHMWEISQVKSTRSTDLLLCCTCACVCVWWPAGLRSLHTVCDLYDLKMWVYLWVCVWWYMLCQINTRTPSEMKMQECIAKFWLFKSTGLHVWSSLTKKLLVKPDVAFSIPCRKPSSKALHAGLFHRVEIRYYMNLLAISQDSVDILSVQVKCVSRCFVQNVSVLLVLSI